MGRSDPIHAEVAVLGAGPGGYTAAFRAADLGKRVALIERYPVLGGVCLHVGCIPSKALLHVADVVHEVEELRSRGVDFGRPSLDLARLRAHKEKVVASLAGGLGKLASQRGVEVVRGAARFEDPNRLVAEGPEGPRTVFFEHAIIAAGSRAAEIPGLPRDDPRVMDSTGALALDDVPERLLVIGGGIIGLEMATVYEALGSRVTVVELLDRLMVEVDADLLRPLERQLAPRLEAVRLSTRVAAVKAEDAGLSVSFEGEGNPSDARFDRILVAVGRRPNGDRIGAERAGVRVDERGFVPVDTRQRTNVPHIYAIGDVAGAPLLAHKAMHEGRVAAEVIAGLPAAFDAVVPSVAYTDPEVAWVGLTESRATAEGTLVDVGRFPWSASGRALGMGRGEGMTKLVFAREDGRLVGAGVVGARAGELIAEATLAIELGADAEDLALTIHPHPSLSESVGLAAEVAHGTITDLLPPRARTRSGRAAAATGKERPRRRGDGAAR